MANRKRKPVPSGSRRFMRLDQQITSIEAQIARMEKDSSVGLAARDHFALWRRPSLFARWPSDRMQ
jgi:hypothetical protein